MLSPNFPKYLSVKQVSDVLNIGLKFCYKHKKEIPGYLVIAGKTMFDSEILFKELKRRASKS